MWWLKIYKSQTLRISHLYDFIARFVVVKNNFPCVGFPHLTQPKYSQTISHLRQHTFRNHIHPVVHPPMFLHILLLTLHFAERHIVPSIHSSIHPCKSSDLSFRRLDHVVCHFATDPRTMSHCKRKIEFIISKKSEFTSAKILLRQQSNQFHVETDCKLNGKWEKSSQNIRI